MTGSHADRWVQIVSEPIASQELLDFVTTSQSGAVVLFLGTVREWTDGQRTVALEYEAYPEMALVVMNELVDEARFRWPITRVALLHRLGLLTWTEASVAVAVSSPHRKEAFAAGEFLIDQLKIRVPIWKKDHAGDGGTHWIHPGTGDQERR